MYFLFVAHTATRHDLMSEIWRVVNYEVFQLRILVAYVQIQLPHEWKKCIFIRSKRHVCSVRTSCNWPLELFKLALSWDNGNLRVQYLPMPTPPKKIRPPNKAYPFIYKAIYRGPMSLHLIHDRQGAHLV